MTACAAPLCDAVLGSPSASGQETLEYLEHANLFIVPLDNERRWYRYHHLFGDLLRQRLHQSASSGMKQEDLSEYHIRASQWYEDNGLDLEAFQHAAAANDIERAARLMEGKGIPLHFHYAVTTILNWLASLPKSVMDAKPLLWIRYASMALVTVQTTGVEERLQAAEAAIAAALQGAEPDENTRNLIGQIATARAMLALFQYRAEDIIAQSQPCTGVSALRQPGFPFYRNLDAGGCLPSSGRPCCCRTSLIPKLYRSARSLGINFI